MKNIILIGFMIILFISGIFSSCKKNNKDTDDGSTQEDLNFYHSVLALQDTAYKKYTVWSQTMDSLEAINKLQQFFLSDPSVTSATLSSQGIAVEYTNGMGGGIFLNPEDSPQKALNDIGLYVNGDDPNLNLKSLVNLKKAIFIDPIYCQDKFYADYIINEYTQDLPKVGFELKIVKDNNANLDQFCQLSDYGSIHVSTHGWAWPANDSIIDVYLMTGEVANDATSEKYKEERNNKTVRIPLVKTCAGMQHVYFINKNFITNHNIFIKDTVLFYGGFCYSFLGLWPTIPQYFAKSAYFGYDWAVAFDKDRDWVTNLVNNLSDTALGNPVTTEDWMNSPLPKSYFDTAANKTVNILYAGDPDLTLWEGLCDGFPPVGASMIYMDASSTFGLMFIFEEVTELIQGKEVYRRRIATDPPNIGSYYACDSHLGQIEVADDNAFPPYQREFFTPPKPFLRFGSQVGTIVDWQGTIGTTASQETFEVVKYENITVPYKSFSNTMVVHDKWYMEGTLVSEEYYWMDHEIGLLKFVAIGETDTMYLVSYTPPVNGGNGSQLANINAHQVIEQMKLKRYKKQ